MHIDFEVLSSEKCENFLLSIINTYLIGDSCLCWSLGDDISLETSKRILQLYKRLKRTLKLKGIRDFVPSYNALAIHFDPLITNIETLKKRVNQSFENLDNELQSSHFTIPVIYDGSDLERIARLTNISKEDIIDLHVSKIYTVAMIGFKPHFPYLIGLDSKLECPRLDSPRKSVKAGSVAIGGKQTGIYPCDSPGGWNIIGSTNPTLLTDLKPGDEVSFEMVEVL